MRDLDAWLKNLVSTLNTTDRQLADEVRHVRRLRSISAPRAAAISSRSRSAPAREARQSVQQTLRNIVLRVGRPVLAVVGGAAQLDFRDSESEVWRSRLQASGDRLKQAAGAVGRINVTGVPDLQYVGTGWLIAKNTIVTNRHVAQEFADRDRGRFTFKMGSGATSMGASIDFLEEVGRPEQQVFPILEVLHIEDPDGPDFALLRVEESTGRELAAPIPLATAPAKAAQQVAVMGYPARDRRAPDDQLVQSIFGDVYDKKRLAPGQVTEARADVLLHDCSTLGGNSGSVVLDLATGEAIGLHFAGRFMEANYAVPAPVVAARLEEIRRHRPSGKPASGHPPHAHGTHTTVVTHAPQGGPSPDLGEFVEGVPADYAGRPGYDPRFVGTEVSLPVIRNSSDVLTFPWDGRDESELKYEHFSVVMSRSRRMCIFSAGNIDGNTPRRFKRPSWRLDPRIPIAQQIKEECYGNEPLFARGHMTRREDPIWGEPDEAARGNSDSMHVTNVVPQMQPFNAGIWLALESYALENARTDHMRISVMTGPFFMPDDPIRKGVLIPRTFWKVIAFVHDETHELCATGYTMSQEDFLRDEEFVFGKHKTAQTRITAIEARAGLSFGPLAALDPFDQEGVDRLLTDPAQIVFRRR